MVKTSMSKEERAALRSTRCFECGRIAEKGETFARITDSILDDAHICPGCGSIRENLNVEAILDDGKSRRVRFCFDVPPVFDGITDDTRWNGFLNVRVTPTTHAAVRAWAATVGDGSLEAFDELKPDANGLFSYAGGFATQEAETCSTCHGVPHRAGGPECPECGDESPRAACDVCGAECGTGSVVTSIGGGTGALCASCGARLCDCGENVIPEYADHVADDDETGRETHRVSACVEIVKGVESRIPSREWGRP